MRDERQSGSEIFEGVHGRRKWWGIARGGWGGCEVEVESGVAAEGGGVGPGPEHGSQTDPDPSCLGTHHAMGCLSFSRSAAQHPLISLGGLLLEQSFLFVARSKAGPPAPLRGRPLSIAS